MVSELRPLSSVTWKERSEFSLDIYRMVVL